MLYVFLLRKKKLEFFNLLYGNVRNSYLQAFVLIDTLMRILIVNVASFALALETTRRIHAPSVSAHCWHQGALVDLLGVICDWIHYLSRHQSAENFMFTYKVVINQCRLHIYLFSYIFFTCVNTYEFSRRGISHRDYPMLPPSNNSTTFSFAVAPWD